MTISQLIERQNREEIILLIRQGLFYRGYEQGAALLHDLFGWQVKSRALKSCDAETLCYVGFPAPSLGRVLEHITAGGGNAEQLEEGRLIAITGYCRDFDREALQAATTPSVARPRRAAAKPTASSDTAEVLSRLRTFDVVGSTPIQCMNFLVTVQQQLNTGHP